ncbi:DUF4270 domain-containing protein [Prevotella sp. 10(H)]|uniref:DUF4270 domain-containing protein n=1 Tax=Prevotella sp. 10(H) TaxID=1158294 RepID=UPI0004A6F847|nr:DUF4270 domain-containing protein [Prevotella sp. 10(H)]
MKIKTFLILTFALFATIFIACDDDASSLGSSIQPGGDDIYAGGDTINLTAETFSFKDSVYAHTVYGLLGEYTDPIFGRVKSDYLCQLSSAENLEFKNPENKEVTIDSVLLNIQSVSFTGDSVSPMGVSVYEVTEPLKAFFFTSVNPERYCNMQEVLGQSVFTIQDALDTVISKIPIRVITTKLTNKLGERFYKEWVDSNGNTFKNQSAFNEFFKGMYITTNFGSGSLIDVDYTGFDIHYSYRIRNVANTADSAVAAIFRLPVNEKVIQMNHVKNEFPENLYLDKKHTYMNTPAGVYTQINIPLNEIVDAATKGAGKDPTINAANLSIKGFTEEEEKSGMARPDYVLLINKDSLQNYFFNERDNMVNGRTTYAIQRNPQTNTYNFNNLASMINYYAKYYKDKGETNLPDLKYLVIPIGVSKANTVINGYNVEYVNRVYNLMTPTSAILRTGEKDIKMSIIYSKY